MWTAIIAKALKAEMADQKSETMNELKDELADSDKRVEKLEAELKVEARRRAKSTMQMMVASSNRTRNLLAEGEGLSKKADPERLMKPGLILRGMESSSYRTTILRS